MHARKTFVSSLAHELNTFWPHIVLFFLVLGLFWTNYTPNTWLIGWDNLLPELNLRVNIVDRSLLGVWQEYQGLGVRAGNAHAADLLRQLLVYFLSNIFTADLIRYAYHFLALYVGAVGIYELITRKLLKHWHTASQAAGFCGAVFSVLNLGTMQNFYVPYESFSHTFASLPWLILALLNALDKPGRRTYLQLAAVNVLATPMFYIPTVFVVYLMVSAVILVPYIIKTRKTHTAATTAGIILCVNAFWLLPFAAFVVHGTAFVSTVKINRLFTQEAFLRNQKFGTIRDVPILRGFLFDTTDMADTTTGENEYMMKPWTDYLADPTVYALHVAVFIAIVLGLLIAIRHKYPYAETVTALFVLSYIALANDNPPTGAMFRFLQSYVPLFKQIFRFPYTKFIVPAVITYSVGLAYAVYAVIGRKHQTAYPVAVAALVLFTYLNAPSFRGHFLYSAMRRAVPAEYAAVYSFLRTLPQHGKIANLPQPTFWGWTAYDWGYRGSGFPWYGIGQPILDRAFDVWNPSNEQYYSDLTRAVYAQASPEAIERVFRKYQISYLWLDERVILPHKPSMLFYDETKRLLSQSAKFTKIYEHEKQSLYAFADAPTSLPVFTTRASTLTTNPFISPDNTGATLSVQGNDVVYRTQTVSGALVIPSGTSVRQSMPGTVRISEGTLEILPLLPTITNNDRILSVKPQPVLSASNIPDGAPVQINDTLLNPTRSNPILLYPSDNLIAVYDKQPSRSMKLTELYERPLENCDLKFQTADTQFGSELRDETLVLFGTKAHPCVYAKLSDLVSAQNVTAARTGILDITVGYSSPNGTVPHICLTRNGSEGCFAEISGTDRTAGLKELRMTVPIKDYPIGDIWIKTELMADGNQESRITLTPVNIDFFIAPGFSQRFASDIVTPVSRIPLEKGTLSLIFPIQTFVSSQILPQNLSGEKKNCFTLGRGKYDKSVMRENEAFDFVRYSATEASSCDSLSFTDPLLANGAIALFVSRNIAGRPLKTCVKIDPPGYCLFEDFVQAERNAWSTSPVLIAPHNPIFKTTNYLELDNYAVGPEIRTNDLASITFLTIPYTWIAGLAVESPYSRNQHTDVQMLSAVKIRLSTPPLHIVTVPDQKAGTLIGLSQSYDSGWVAFRVTPTFPYLAPAGRHILVNNWANGWQLSDTSQPNTHVYIFFWPQLLEWIGFLLLPLPFILMLRKRAHHHEHI